MHTLIIVPGLGDNISFVETITTGLRSYINVKVITFNFGWTNPANKLEDRLELFSKLIDSESKTNKVSLIGISGGGSAVLNAFFDNSQKVEKVVNICGRLKKGINLIPSLSFASKGKPMFKDSVLRCENLLKGLTSNQSSRMMTIRPLFDEIVPTPLVSIEGAFNKKIIAVEHILSIAIAFKFYSKSIIKFLEEED